MEVPRPIVGSIFHKKWTYFDGKDYQTPRLNEAANLIYHINKELGHKKTGKIASHCIFPVQYS